MEIDCQTYKIHIGSSFFQASSLREHDRDWFLITDTNIYQLYKELIDSWKFPFYTIQPGELHKSRDTKLLIENFLLQNNCNKRSGIIALGGGVVGDISGFVASTYMRGIDYIQVPTTLLAMVDSSVGGKTAVDTPYAKNSIGRIYRPKAVYIDISFLNTLPLDMWAAGFSEIIKMSLIYDLELYKVLKSHTIVSLQQDPHILLGIIAKSIQHKVDIVTLDEFDSKLRLILNFGHTIGHAIEAELDGQWNHGHCVSVGMIKELEVAQILDRTEIDIDEIKEILKVISNSAISPSN